ncbi:MAG: phosphonate C-P lyase system protein PhnG [Dehalococcoidia bacterium]|nr:phosphonate C-P lyase system protein PhnG [Dehalococcoidia bacterium]
MLREERLEAMSAAPDDQLVALADEVLEGFDIELTRGPVVGLLMMRVEEPAEGLTFNFTEVTVSEAEVTAGDHRGYAMLMGRVPEKALAAAVLDAALEAGHQAAPRIEELLVSARRDETERWSQRWETVAPTRVQFEDIT